MLNHSLGATEYWDHLDDALFCLCPRGYAVWSPRLLSSSPLSSFELDSDSSSDSNSYSS